MVVDHSFEAEEYGYNRNHRPHEKRYTHSYTLRQTDGTPIKEPLTYFGSNGYKEIDEGTTFTVLLDSDTGKPLRPLEDVHFGTGAALTAAGLAVSFGM